MNQYIDGFVIRIYGAAGSIGSAVARVFGRERSTVFLVGPTAPGIERVARELAHLTLLKRTPTLKEIGNVGAMMASDCASPVTATVANISCGMVVD